MDYSSCVFACMIIVMVFVIIELGLNRYIGGGGGGGSVM